MTRDVIPIAELIETSSTDEYINSLEQRGKALAIRKVEYAGLG